MEFSWLAFVLTGVVVLVEAFFVWRDGNLSRRQKNCANLSFLLHWGVSIGDLIILSIVNGIIIPNLKWSVGWFSIYEHMFVASILITWFCHKLWWPTTVKSLGFIFPNWNGSNRLKRFWYRDISKAGWIHFIFMTFQLVALMAYMITPMPDKVVLIIGGLFLIFLPVSTVEPGYIQSGDKKPSALNIASIISREWLGVFLFTSFKILFPEFLKALH
jgi:hypothetical protein